MSRQTTTPETKLGQAAALIESAIGAADHPAAYGPDGLRSLGEINSLLLQLGGEARHALQRQITAADAAGIPRLHIAELAQIGRATLYRSYLPDAQPRTK